MTTEASAPTTAEQAADFVERFATAWGRSDIDLLLGLLAEDVVLTQPIMPTTRGRDAARKSFARLFRVAPDLQATVHRWAADGDVVFIEFTLAASYGGREVSWPAVDRFVLRDGLAAERISYFDPLPLGIKLATNPRGWRQLLGR